MLFTASAPRGGLSPIVIGAGISGLARAVALVRSGARPIVIDPYVPGGLIRSALIDGFTLECGAGTFALTPAMKNLLEILGLEDLMRFPAIEHHRHYVWHDGSACQVPLDFGSLLNTKLLSLRERFSFMRGFQGKLLMQAPNLTVHDLISTLFSPHIAEVIAAPMLRGIFGGDTRALLARLVFPKLFEHLRRGGTVLQYMQAQKSSGGRKIFTLQGGNEELVKGCLRYLEGKSELTRGVVTGLEYESTSKTFSLTLNSGVTLSSNSVHIATSGEGTASYIGKLSNTLAGALQKVRYAPLAVYHVALPRDVKLPRAGFGILVPPGEGDLVLGLLFNSQLFPHSAPATKHLATVCLGGIGGESVLKSSAAELEAALRAATKKYLGFDSPQILKSTLWARGIPQYESVLLDVHTEMEKIERAYPSLCFIGADRGGIGVPARVDVALRL